MHVLIVDHEPVAAGILKSKLSGWGHQVELCGSANEAANRMRAQRFHVVIFDPAPMASGQVQAIQFRRAAGDRYVCLIMASRSIDGANFLAQGLNGFVRKPFDPRQLQSRFEEAGRLFELLDRLDSPGRESGLPAGVLDRASFHQIIQSQLEQSHRIGQTASLLVVRITNLEDVRGKDPAAFTEFSDAFAGFLVKFRRRTDLLGRVAENEYCILLNNTPEEHQVRMAVKRMLTGLQWQLTAMADQPVQPRFTVSALVLPTGAKLAEIPVHEQANLLLQGVAP